MGFSELKNRTLTPKKEKALSTFLLALLTAACLFVPYMILSEGYFTFYGDFNVQQIPFYQKCHEAIKSGNIFWDFETDLGANFIGSYSFYLLGSPFFWLTIPFPNSFVPYLMGPLLILKFACAALTAYFYIRRFTRTPEAARLGGLLYAFSGFSVYNIFFNHFHEAIILFPLLLLSLEMLITENRRFVFALTVCLCAVSNYFFFFGMVVFTVIYFFVRLFSGAIKLKFSRFLVVVFEAVLGLLLSSFILLPSIMAITGNSRISEFLMGWNAIMYGKEQIYGNILQCFFFPPDIPARPVFFPGAEVKWSSLGGWLPVFSMVGVFTWFKTKTGSWLKRLIGICIFMALVPILNSAFYAFNTAYYARWYYMPILLMCLMTVSLTEDREVNWSYGFWWVSGITVAITAVIGFFPQKDDDGNIIYGIYTQGDDLTYVVRFAIACVIAIVSLIILYFLLKILKSNAKSFYTMSVACVCIISVIYGNVFIISGRTHSYEIKDVMIDSLIEGDVDFNDDENFRIDTYDAVDNTAMYLGYSGINAFHSVVPSSIMEFYEYIGVERSVASRPDTGYESIRPLLSVKYLLNRVDGDSFIDTETKETEMQGYTYLDTQSGFYVYENDNFLPYGFSYKYYMSESFCESYSGKNRANLMLKAMLLTDEQIEKYSGILKNFEGFSRNPAPNDEGRSLYFSYEDMVYDCDKLRETSAIYFETDKRGFSATVKREKENLVFFSIPFDEGWTATVNGEACEIEKVNVGFMAVKVPAGTSEIRFEYTTPGLKIGLLTTAFSCLIFLVYMLAFLVYRKKHIANNVYPEGEILLKSWSKAEEEQVFEEQERYLKSESLLDLMDEIIIPKIENGFEGGFKISPQEDEED
ncbi:MAG: YfhO family protein [Clostridia bacterium]|nr:YfhO family protein [Clostridia bacterium]